MTSRNNVAETWSARLKRLAGNFGVSALTAIIVSGLVTAWFETRLENSKQRVMSVFQKKEQFDSSQSAIFAQLALYTDVLFKMQDNADSSAANKDELRKAIINTQFQLERLKAELKNHESAVLGRYAEELDRLSTAVRRVEAKKDLAPVYVSAQKILALHDEVSERLRGNMEISVFR